MSGEKFFPCCLPASLWCGLDPMLLQDVGNSFKRQQVTEIGKCSLNPAIAPVSILFRHARHQRGNLASRSWASWIAVGAPIILLRDQLSMPPQQRLGSHDGGDLSEELPADFLRSRCQSSTLVIAETHSAVVDLFAQTPISLDQVMDEMLLMLVHPTGQGYDEERKWVQEHAHCRRLSGTLSALLFSNDFNPFEFLHSTRWSGLARNSDTWFSASNAQNRTVVQLSLPVAETPDRKNA